MVDVCSSRSSGHCDCVFDGGFSKRESSTGESRQITAERVRFAAEAQSIYFQEFRVSCASAVKSNILVGYLTAEKNTSHLLHFRTIPIFLSRRQKLPALSRG